MTTISKLCLGTAKFGSQMSQEDSWAMMDAFVEQGGNFFDTAHIYGAWDKAGVNGGYGNSELVIGDWLKGKQRSDYVIATKCAHPDFDTKASRMNKEDIHRELHESLDRLGGEYIDYYYLHRDQRDIPVAEIISWFEEPLAQGLIKHLACSHWRVDRLREAVAITDSDGQAIIKASQIAWSLAVAQNTCSEGPYGEQLAWDAHWAEFHQATQLCAIPYNTQAMGFFSGRYDGYSEKEFTSDDFPKPGIARNYGTAANYQRRSLAQQIAENNGLSTNQVALAYLLQQDFPSHAIIGPSTIEQLTDSMKAQDLYLSAEDLKALSAIK